MIVGQDKAAGVGLGRNLDRDRAHALRQHRGEETGSLGHDDIGIADRIARHQRNAHDGAGEIGDRIRAVGLLDVIRIGRGRRPGLPSDVRSFDHLSPVELGFGDQHVRGFKLHDRRRRRRRRRRLAAGRQIRGDAARGDSDPEYHQTRGFHYASLST